MNKTIREHLETLPEPYRSQALASTTPERMELEAKDVKEALLAFREWTDTPEAYEHWSNLYKTL